MAKEISTTRQQELAYLSAYGKQAARQNSIVGKLMRFTKGEYLAGQDDEEIAAGTRVIVNVDSALAGWTLWMNQKPMEQDMGQIIKGFQPKMRSELSMADETEWPNDDRGQPRDPWQFGNQMLMKGIKDGSLYTFSTTSKGGISAIGKLLDEATAYMQEGNDDYPIIELNIDFYKHAQHGKIYFPVFTIVGWSAISEFTLESPTKTKVAASKAAAPMRKTKNGGGRALTYK